MRAIREARKVSLRGLADLTGLDRGYLSRVERGQVREPADLKIQSIATALGVPPAAITHEETP
ncbi:helix-turn-helix domain-containing protein [Streptomyces sp. NPDC007063]|uniref:helix-turn-helix domain-containing protein n=1 Tax=Streptomyces sp. NPDC007063 TaxID=3364772 RepID=UPI003690438B